MITGFIKIAFLPLCSKFTSDASSQGRSFKTALLPPRRDPSPQGPALPPTQAREPPPVSPVCLSPLQQDREGGRSRRGRSRGLRQQSAVRQFSVFPAGAQRPGPGEAGRREAPVCRVCQSGPARGPARPHHLDRGGRAAARRPLAGGAGADRYLSSPRDAPDAGDAHLSLAPGSACYFCQNIPPTLMQRSVTSAPSFPYKK